MNYAELVTALGLYSEQVPPNESADFLASIPTFISNAENRIYRELDFLATRQQTAGLTFTVGQRSLPLSVVPVSGQSLLTIALLPILTSSNSPILTTNAAISTNAVYPVVVQGLAAIVPSGTAASVGKRVRYRWASLDWIDSIWPNEAITAVPTSDNAYFTMLSDSIAVVCPTPPAPYTVELTGTWLPDPISIINTETWLSKFEPDLLFIACMVEVSGWMRDFGAQSDNPQMAVSWATRYDQAKGSALEQEQRRKSQGPGWQPYSPTPLAQPSR